MAMYLHDFSMAKWNWTVTVINYIVKGHLLNGYPLLYTVHTPFEVD